MKKIILLMMILPFLQVQVNADDVKKERCEYYEKKKEEAEERMRQLYKAYEYNRLEANRKYWKNKYLDNCPYY